MRTLLAALCLAVALSPAWGADPAKPPDRFPQLAGDSPAVQRMNRGFTSLDKKFVKALANCRKDDASNDADRSVEVTLKGAHYYAVVAYENWFCGGAHPDSDSMALTYDLGTGRPVDWVKLLPGLNLKGSTDNVFDGSVIGLVASKKLSDFYVSELKKAPDYDKECDDAFTGDLTFQLWPAKGGVTVSPASLPHVVAACGDSVTLPTARLSELGAPAALVADIQAVPAAKP